MRYGENAHQQAAFYIEENIEEASIARKPITRQSAL